MGLLCSQSAAEVSKEALERLPPDTGAGDAGGCSVAVRFPDGRRAQRRFPRTAPLQALRDFCLANSEEAAAGRSFALSESMPGATCAGSPFPVTSHSPLCSSSSEFDSQCRPATGTFHAVIIWPPAAPSPSPNPGLVQQPVNR